MSLYVRWLTAPEKKLLRIDMSDASTWARAELKRRREEKVKQSTTKKHTMK